MKLLIGPLITLVLKNTMYKDKFIGFSCDGTNVNIAKGGLKGLLTKEFPWLVVNWCLSHRLELLLKDGVTLILLMNCF